jgi:hypothetical protein
LALCKTGGPKRMLSYASLGATAACFDYTNERIRIQRLASEGWKICGP